MAPLLPRLPVSTCLKSGPLPGAPSLFPRTPLPASSSPLLWLLLFWCLSLPIRVSTAHGQKSAASSVLVTMPGAPEALGDLCEGTEGTGVT